MSKKKEVANKLAVTLSGTPVTLYGAFPAVGQTAPEFTLVDKDLKEHTLQEFRGKRKIIATVPSLDTPTCSLMTKHLNELAKKHPKLAVIVVSADLPFAQKRFCEGEGVHNTITLSMMRDKEFGKAYGVLIQDGPLAGILARAVFLLDEKDHLLYVELVPEITKEPNYHAIHKVIE